MTKRRNKASASSGGGGGGHTIDWGVWFRSFGVWLFGTIISVAGLATAFYFTTKFTLQEHEKNFVEIGKKFDGFQATLKDNYERWAAANKSEIEKAELRAKEERDLRDKMREEFRTTFTNFATATTATRVQVDTITKQLDGLANKLDGITERQQRALRGQ